MDNFVRKIEPDDIPEVMHLAKCVFDQFQAPNLIPEGIKEFHSYIEINKAILRFNTDHFGLLSIKDNKIVGMIEIRNYNHISLLFVDPSYHKQGIASLLWTESLKICKNKNNSITTFSVFSSPYALAVYEKFGFKKTSSEQIKNGIRFFPMTMDVRMN